MAYPYVMTYTPVAGDTILAAHITTSNQEHIDSNIPENIDDYSVNATEMGTTQDPYAADTEVLAVSLSDELKGLRYQIESLIKKFNASASKWYHNVTNEGPLVVKGADVASASALPLISDGMRADVTGQSSITSFNSVGVGTLKLLQFDDVCTLVHHSTDLVLPGGINISTLAGDRVLFHEYASGDWELVAASGFPGKWDLISSVSASASATVNFSGKFDANHDLYIVVLKEVILATDNQSLRVRVGPSSTYDSGVADYAYVISQSFAQDATANISHVGDDSIDHIVIASGIGNDTNEALDGIVYVHDPLNSGKNTRLTCDCMFMESNADPVHVTGGGYRLADQADDSIQFYSSSGNITSGDFLLYGLRI